MLHIPLSDLFVNTEIKSVNDWRSRACFLKDPATLIFGPEGKSWNQNLLNTSILIIKNVNDWRSGACFSNDPVTFRASRQNFFKIKTY